MIRCAALAICVLMASSANADEPSSPRKQLQFNKWSGNINVPDPVAIAFDNLGRAYVTQTQRRKSQDLDIRQNRAWVPFDVGFQSVQDKRDFYHLELAVGDDAENAEHVQDMNDDGHYDYRDLIVLSEKIHQLEDVDGDGVADSIREFAEGFRTEVTGIAAGVLHHDGHVYATIAPDVWKLTDTDNDGAADQREIFATGFGLHIAYAGHDMHGLTVGPDGKIYWSVGDKGISAASKAGERFHYPNQGGVMRCNPDGTDFEVFAHGLRNVQELAFDQFGNLFGVDNDADKTGERERFVYIVKDMDAGWRCHYQYRGNDYDPWMAEGLWQTFHDQQPAYIVPPISYSIDGPAGFAFNPGTALSPAYKNFFFLTGAPNGNQIAFQVQANGASFKMSNEHKIGSGIPLVGINFGPDGALYGVDWGGGYPLNQTGAVWKIDDAASATSAIRKETRSLLAAGFTTDDKPTLLSCLAHADQRVRLGAQFELAKRNSMAEFMTVASDDEAEILARVHAIWGLGQLKARVELAKLVRRFSRSSSSGLDQGVSNSSSTKKSNADAELLSQVLRTAGNQDDFASDAFSELLRHPSPRVRFAAASALADHPTDQAFDTLVAWGAELKLDESYLRFALARALTTCATSEQLVALRNHPVVLVQLAAVVALRRQKSPAVRRFLGGADWVASEAARAIHDDFSIVEALPDLAKALNERSNEPTELSIETSKQASKQTSNRSDAFVLRAINANFRLGTPASAERLLMFTESEQATVSHRLVAIEAIGLWNQPPVLDRVTGRARMSSKQGRDYNPDRVAKAISRLVASSNADIASTALATAAKLNVQVDDAGLLRIAADEASATSVRIEALNLLQAQSSPELLALLRELLQAKPTKLRIRVLELLAVLDREAAVNQIAAIASTSKNRSERQRAVSLLSEVGNSQADQVLLGYVSRLADDDKSIDDIRLEIIEAAAARLQQHDGIAKLMDAYQTTRAARATTDPTASFDECFVGGDRKRGASLFHTHIAAQCVRCHRVGRSGSEVGPRLDGVASRRDDKHLLRAMIAPSADIDANYRTQVAVLDSGEAVQGVLQRRDETSIVLKDAMGKEIVISLDEIEELSEQSISIMPEVATVLSRYELRDLFSYLKSLQDNPSESSAAKRE